MGHAIALISLLFVAAASASQHPADAEVEWNGAWYEAVILDQAGDQTLIHYVGYDASWDEWVGPQRIHLIPPPIAAGQWRVGDPVEVEWGGTWWKAVVLDVQGQQAKIRYVGYDASWDEWVGPQRIR